jgi:hypothetical protein
MTPRRPAAPDGKTIACAFWTDKMQLPHDHPTVREAVNVAGNGACERAYARLRDKEYASANPDLTLARRVENRQAFFVWALKAEIRAAYDQRAQSKNR